MVLEPTLQIAVADCTSDKPGWLPSVAVIAEMPDCASVGATVHATTTLRH